MSKLKLAVIVLAVALTACGGGTTSSGGYQHVEPVVDARCESLLKQCRFNKVDGCIAIKQTPEKAEEDKEYFDQNCI
jgi:hypothetical protein